MLEPKILMLDDYRYNRELYKAYLGEHYNYLEVESIPEFEKYTKRNIPDVFIINLDSRKLKTTCFNALLINLSPAIKSKLIILMSNSVQTDEDDEVRKLGAESLLYFPVSKDQLLFEVETILDANSSVLTRR